MADIERTERSDRAVELHLMGCNCAQAVLCAFADLTGLDEGALLKVASGFGGGVSGTRGQCGAVSGMIMALGLIHGSSGISDMASKHRLYAEGALLINAFKAEFGTSNCGELMREVAPRYKEERHPLVSCEAPKPCSQFVAYAAALLDDFLKSSGEQQI